MSNPFLGQIEMFGGNFAPRNWAFCDGTLLAISSNTALFSILGTTYGGDGRTTFALPDLRGRVPIHEGNGPGLPTYTLGQKSGQHQLTLTAGQMPSHSHAADDAKLRATTTAADTTNPTGNSLATATGPLYHDTEAPSVDMSADSVDVDMGDTGGGQAYNKMPPYQAINFIIAIQGTFPSRN